MSVWKIFNISRFEHAIQVQHTPNVAFSSVLTYTNITFVNVHYQTHFLCRADDKFINVHKHFIQEQNIITVCTKVQLNSAEFLMDAIKNILIPIYSSALVDKRDVWDWYD